MSVLKALKGTFQNVQQDIVDGLRALTSLDATPRHEKLKQLRAEGISLDGGADLLYRYQKNWSEMQNYTADTAKRAEEVDDMVGWLFSHHEKHWHCVSKLEEEAANLPVLTTTIDSMIRMIGSLQKDFKAVEEELDRLLNICEEEEFAREKQSHMQQLSIYRKQKEAETKNIKSKLWKMLSDKAKDIETRKLHSVKEKQDALMEAFTNDMQFYRAHGRPDRLPSGTEFPKVSSLSEITIEEDDKKALDQFLSSGEHSDHSDHSGEAFIEDDYIADYSCEDQNERPESFSEMYGEPEVLDSVFDVMPALNTDGIVGDAELEDKSEKENKPNERICEDGDNSQSTETDSSVNINEKKPNLDNASG